MQVTGQNLGVCTLRHRSYKANEASFNRIMLARLHTKQWSSTLSVKFTIKWHFLQEKNINIYIYILSWKNHTCRNSTKVKNWLQISGWEVWLSLLAFPRESDPNFLWKNSPSLHQGNKINKVVKNIKKHKTLIHQLNSLWACKCPRLTDFCRLRVGWSGTVSPQHRTTRELAARACNAPHPRSSAARGAADDATRTAWRLWIAGAERPHRLPLTDRHRRPDIGPQRAHGRWRSSPEDDSWTGGGWRGWREARRLPGKRNVQASASFWRSS